MNSAPLEVTDADGHLRWSGRYDTFGRLKGQTIAGAALREGAMYDQPLRYAGQYEDGESGGDASNWLNFMYNTGF